jgi:ATP-dependent DNA ligase
MSPKKGTQKSAKSTTASGKTPKGFTDEERAAMKERIQELKADKADGESVVLARSPRCPNRIARWASGRTGALAPVPSV